MKKFRLTKLDLTTAGLCLLAIIPGLAVYNRLPEKIARHFDVQGNPDGYSGRGLVVFGLPLLVTAIHLLSCLLINRDPKSDNAGKLKETIKFFCPTVLYMVQAMILMYALDDSVDVTSITMTLYAILLIIIGNLLPKVKVNGSIGIRTTHTMENEEVWRKSHRFAGKLWVLLGVCMLPFALLGKILPIILLFTAMIIVPIIYSEKVYKEEKNKETK